MLTALLIILLSFMALLLIPIGAESRLANERHRMSFVLAGIRFPIKATSGKALRKRIKKTTADPVRQLSVMQASALEIWEYFEGELPHRLWITLRRYVGCLRLKVHRFNLCIGSGNPATTGLAYGAACATAGMLPRKLPVNLSVDFELPRSELDYRISLTIIPARLLFEVLRSMVTLRVWAVYRIARAAKTKSVNAREAT